MKSGLKDELRSRVSIREHFYDVKKGFVTHKFGRDEGCKSYVPVNQMALDILDAIDATSLRQTARNLRAVISLFNGLVTNSNERYGYIIGPVGEVALSTKELPGEKHSRLRKDLDCEDGCDSQRVNLAPPVGLCNDQ